MNNNSDNNKDHRRQKFLNKSKLNSNKKNDYSEEQRFMSKSKKELKRKLEDMRGDELWEDWDDSDR